MSGKSPEDKDSNSNDDRQSPPRKLTLNEAQHLLKAEIVEQLRKRGAQFDENSNRDALRTQLVNIVKQEAATGASAQDPKEISEDNTEHKQTDSVDDSGDTSSENESSRSSSSDEIMSDEKRKIFFQLETDDWEAFSERLDLYFEAKNITEAKIKRAELLTRCDESTYQLFRNLCAPDKPATKSYVDLTALMRDHLKPVPSEVMERCTYYRARQEQDETVAEFAARLRKLSLHCKFKELEEALRDQFICGIRDEATRVELFKQATVTFDLALKEATARERTVQNAAGALKTLTSDKIYKHENFYHEHHGKANKNKSYLKYGNNTKRNSGATCYCCGYTGHPTKSCRYRDQTCRFCNIKGHL